MKLLGSLVLSLLLTGIILLGCDSKTNTKNYFAETGIRLPSSSNDAVNQIMAGFPKLYNELSAAVEKGDKDARPELATAYADWLVQVIETKENLPDDEKGKFTTELEIINAKWREQIDKLL
jgi:hypothetical protein